MPQYRTKPVAPAVIEAEKVSAILDQVKGGTFPEWIRPAYEAGRVSFGTGFIALTGTGGVNAKLGHGKDYIVCQADGTLDTFDGQAFELTYELVPGSS